jgi:hypothetical protein
MISDERSSRMTTKIELFGAGSGGVNRFKQVFNKPRCNWQGPTSCLSSSEGVHHLALEGGCLEDALGLLGQKTCCKRGWQCCRRCCKDLTSSCWLTRCVCLLRTSPDTIPLCFNLPRPRPLRGFTAMGTFPPRRILPCALPLPSFGTPSAPFRHIGWTTPLPCHPAV